MSFWDTILSKVLVEETEVHFSLWWVVKLIRLWHEAEVFVIQLFLCLWNSIQSLPSIASKFLQNNSAMILVDDIVALSIEMQTLMTSTWDMIENVPQIDFPTGIMKPIPLFFLPATINGSLGPGTLEKPKVILLQ